MRADRDGRRRMRWTSITLALPAIVLFAGVALAYAPAAPQAETASAASGAAVLAADTCKMAPSYYVTLAQKKALMDQLVSQYDSLNLIIATEQAHNTAGIFNAILRAQIALRNDVAQRKNLAINDYSRYLNLQARCG